MRTNMANNPSVMNIRNDVDVGSGLTNNIRCIFKQMLNNFIINNGLMLNIITVLYMNCVFVFCDLG